MICKSHGHLATLVESQKKETEPAVPEFYIYKVTEILLQNFIIFVGPTPKPSYPMTKSVSLLQYVFSFVLTAYLQIIQPNGETSGATGGF